MRPRWCGYVFVFGKLKRCKDGVKNRTKLCARMVRLLSRVNLSGPAKSLINGYKWNQAEPRRTPQRIRVPSTPPFFLLFINHLTFWRGKWCAFGAPFLQTHGIFYPGVSVEYRPVRRGSRLESRLVRRGLGADVIIHRSTPVDATAFEKCWSHHHRSATWLLHPLYAYVVPIR